MVSGQKIKLTVAYDGSEFVGWQRQNLPGANNRSVQGELERSLRHILGQAVSVQGAGRTDSGVHAFAQVASVEVDTAMPVERLAYALNNSLPGDVRIVAAEAAADDFHARFAKSAKEYRYYLVVGRSAGAFDQRYAWFCPYRLDAARMAEAAVAFVGEHDFRSFCGKSAVVTTYVRTLYESEFGLCSVDGSMDGSMDAAPEHLRHLAAAGVLYCYRVRGNGFVYRMVRLLMGALVGVGRGRLDVADLRRALSSSVEQPLSPAAPAHGLYLHHIEYE